MGGQLFNRITVVTVGTSSTTGLSFQGLRTQFRLEKNNQPDPNDGEITVWNLSPSTRKLIQAQANQPGGVPLILKAGYGTADNAQILFYGDILPYGIAVARNGPDWLTTFRIGDGLSSYRGDRVALAQFPPNSSVSTVVTGLIKQLSSDKINFSNVLSSIGGLLTGKPQTYPKGTVVHGGVLQEVNKILKGHGIVCTCQNGTLVVAPIGGTAAVTGTVPSLSSSTGLIGSPEPSKDNFIKFKCLLRPEILPFGKVFVTYGTPPVQLTVTAHKVLHTGDTRGQEWYTDVEGKSS